MLAHELHSEADAEHRLAEREDYFVEASLSEMRHGCACLADAGENDAVGAAYGVGVVCNLCVDT